MTSGDTRSFWTHSYLYCDGLVSYECFRCVTTLSLGLKTPMTSDNNSISGTTNKKTLVIDHSVLKGIMKRGLKKDIDVIKGLCWSHMDLNAYLNIVIYLGGNDAVACHTLKRQFVPKTIL